MMAHLWWYFDPLSTLINKKKKKKKKQHQSWITSDKTLDPHMLPMLLTHAITQGLYIGCVGTRAYGGQVTSLLCQSDVIM